MRVHQGPKAHADHTEIVGVLFRDIWVLRGRSGVTIWDLVVISILTKSLSPPDPPRWKDYLENLPMPMAQTKTFNSNP